MRSVHAALLGTDSLIVIDEAHLVPPFKALIRRVALFSRPTPVPSRCALWHFPPQVELNRRKQSLLLRASADKIWRSAAGWILPRELRSIQTDDLPRSVGERAFELGLDGARVIIFCNSRDKLGRVVHDDLQRRAAKVWKDQSCTALLVGARRVAEREGLTGRRDPASREWIIRPDPVFERFLSSTDPGSSGIPAFLIATSAGEVGVDLDADHMVCDLVPWERMVQRLGRVNRSGRETPALVDVFLAPPAEDAEDDHAEEIAVLRAPSGSSSLAR